MTSLSLASQGLLDRGSLASLAIASLGHLVTTTGGTTDTAVTTAGPARSFGTQYRAKTLSREARERERAKARKRIVRSLEAEGVTTTPGLNSLIEAGLEDAIMADFELTRKRWEAEHKRIERLILLAAINAAIDEEEAVLLLLAAT